MALVKWRRVSAVGWQQPGEVWFCPLDIERVIQAPAEQDVCEVRLKNGETFDLAYSAAVVVMIAGEHGK